MYVYINILLQNFCKVSPFVAISRQLEFLGHVMRKEELKHLSVKDLMEKGAEEGKD